MLLRKLYRKEKNEFFNEPTRSEIFEMLQESY